MVSGRYPDWIVPGQVSFPMDISPRKVPRLDFSPTRHFPNWKLRRPDTSQPTISLTGQFPEYFHLVALNRILCKIQYHQQGGDYTKQSNCSAEC